MYLILLLDRLSTVLDGVEKSQLVIKVCQSLPSLSESQTKLSICLVNSDGIRSVADVRSIEYGFPYFSFLSQYLPTSEVIFS